MTPRTATWLAAVVSRLTLLAARPAASFGRYFPQTRAERLIAGGRLGLTCFSAVAVVLGPPARYPQLVQVIVLAYLVYAGYMVCRAWAALAPSTATQVCRLLIDTAVAFVLLAFTAGSNSGFFPFVVFPVLCATLRWQWRGALATGIGIMLAFGAVGLMTRATLGEPTFELNRLAMRIGYLGVLTAILTYIAFYEERGRREITALAALSQLPFTRGRTLVASVLAHAAAVVSAPRLLLIWREADQPWLTVAHWSRGALTLTREPPAALDPLVAAPLAEADFLCDDGGAADARVLCRSGDRLWRWHGAPLHPKLQSTHDVHAVLAAPLGNEFVRGLLLVLDKRAATSDDLALVGIVARQVQAYLQRDHVTRLLEEAAVVDERRRIGRDMHDGALQSLTAIAFRLEAVRRLMETAPARATGVVEELQNLVELEQRQLRSLVVGLQAKHAGAAEHGFADLLTELTLWLDHEWHLPVKVETNLRMGHFDAPLSPHSAREIYQILREALVNVARHALASVAVVIITVEDGEAHIEVSDNGQGFPFRGHYEHADLARLNLGPVMLRARISALGGSLAITSSDDGARLDIRVPLGPPSGPK